MPRTLARRWRSGPLVRRRVQSHSAEGITDVNERSLSDRNVLLIGSEAVPFAKTGGLADVLGTLPVELSKLGWPTTIVLPRYRGVSDGELVEHFPISIGGYMHDVGF